jgi:DNA-binding HxlR family transcriptional regulator
LIDEASWSASMGLPLRKSRVEAPPPQCPLALCMELLRGAWAPNVLWYLRAGPRRFGELRHDIPRISARVLSARLREMEVRGMIERRLLDTSPPSAEYELTALGHELLPALDAIAKVGMKLRDDPKPRRRAA